MNGIYYFARGCRKLKFYVCEMYPSFLYGFSHSLCTYKVPITTSDRISYVFYFSFIVKMHILCIFRKQCPLYEGSVVANSSLKALHLIMVSFVKEVTSSCCCLSWVSSPRKSSFVALIPIYIVTYISLSLKIIRSVFITIKNCFSVLGYCTWH